MIQLKDLNVRDPYIYSEDGVYYLYASASDRIAFVCYRSRDMAEFEEPVTVFAPEDGFWATKDFWAPELHRYGGKYYLFASLKSDVHPRGTQIFVSDRPDGRFEPLTEYPITPCDWECLDGTLYVENGVPYMIFCREWSSYSESGYAMGVCESKSLFGPWVHCAEPINKNNGGHGMVLTRDEKDYLVYHAPNDPAGYERVKFMPFEKPV